MLSKQKAKWLNQIIDKIEQRQVQRGLLLHKMRQAIHAMTIKKADGRAKKSKRASHSQCTDEQALVDAILAEIEVVNAELLDLYALYFAALDALEECQNT